MRKLKRKENVASFAEIAALYAYFDADRRGCRHRHNILSVLRIRDTMKENMRPEIIAPRRLTWSPVVPERD